MNSSPTEQPEGFDRAPFPVGGVASDHGGGSRQGPRLAIVTAVVVLMSMGLVVFASERTGAAPDPTQPFGLRGHVLEEPIPKPAFTLADDRARPFDFAAETNGKLALLFFGFTNCADICPVHMANLAAVLAELPYRDRSRIRVVFVTADPDRDSPARIRQWLDRFDPRFTGLRGSVAAVNEILAELALPPVTHGEPDDQGRYHVGHPAQVLAFTPDGPLRVAYPFGTRQADWARDLPKLLAWGSSAGPGAQQPRDTD